MKLTFDLINPTNSFWRVGAAGLPKGPRMGRYSMLTSLSVAAAVPDFVNVRIVDEDIEPVDFDSDADVIGISFMTFNAPRAYEIADRYRAKGKTVIVGGYHPTFLPEEAKQHADAVCAGEAEYNVPRMFEDIRAGHLQPIYRSHLVDLSDLRPLDRSVLDGSQYSAVSNIQATRGCPYRCDFCSIAKFSEYKFRTRPIDDVIRELEGLGRWVMFMDDNLIGDPSYAAELFARMTPLKKRWFSQCSVRIAYNDKLLDLAAKSGCAGLFVGFESLSQSNLRSSGKRINRAEDYTRVVEKLHRAGMGVYGGFVFGMDEDGPDVFRRTLQFMHDAKVDVIQATNLTPFPGTPLFDQFDREGRIFDYDWSHYDFGHVVCEPVGMSAETLGAGTAWIQQQFYGRRPMAKRLARSLGYLPTSLIMKALVPINLGHRVRHRVTGTFAKAQSFPELSRAAWHREDSDSGQVAQKPSEVLS